MTVLEVMAQFGFPGVVIAGLCAWILRMESYAHKQASEHADALEKKDILLKSERDARVDDARQFNQALLLQTSELIKVANELSSVAEKMALMGDVVRELQVHQLSQAPPQPQLPGRRR